MDKGVVYSREKKGEYGGKEKTYVCKCEVNGNAIRRSLPVADITQLTLAKCNRTGTAKNFKVS